MNIPEEQSYFSIGMHRVYCKTIGQQVLMRALIDNKLVIVYGLAGTGKTHISVSYGLSLLFNGYVRRLIVSRPVVSAGEDLGYLPGDMREKVDPYLRPVFDVLEEFCTQSQLNEYLARKIIEIAPISFMRGRTLKDSFIVLDEAQNTTPLQMKMFLTRLGAYSYMVITGDLTQVDIAGPSGLQDAVQRLKNISGVSIIQLSLSDVVREPLTKSILEAYER